MCYGKVRQPTVWLLLPVSMGLLSCAMVPAKQAPVPKFPTPTAAMRTSETQSFQILPLTLLATINQTQFKLAVAETPQQQQLGLMFRPALPDDEGMLFPFQPARRVGFWMKNTLIPLDLLYIREGIIREIQHKVPPCQADPCPTYPSEGEIDQVIELRGGRAQELQIQVGDRVYLTPIEPS